jgi:aconitate hydratase
MLREKGVVGKFVEFFGEGLDSLSLADRATIANMAPEYGATCGLFPIDAETLRYLALTGRREEQIALVEAYAREQGLFRDSRTAEAEYSDTLDLDMGTVVPCLAGPKRPQDRILLREAKSAFARDLARTAGAENDAGPRSASLPDGETELRDGSIVIAAITSCTNTSNPAVMLAAGLVARNAARRGLKARSWVKTSLAPGSKVVTEYLQRAGLLEELESVGFHLVGYGCTTCIGNSGPLPEPIAKAITEHDLSVAAVLSGNRNFEGRVHALVKMNYLASPPLVVAYAIAGRMDLDPTSEPLAEDPGGNPVYLQDLWPAPEEVNEALESIRAEMFESVYDKVFEGDEHWNHLEVPSGELFRWDADSTYIRQAPFFQGMGVEPEPVADLEGARVLALLGDSVTTDHISPAGAFSGETPAGRYLIDHGVDPADFNSYGSRRGNHEVMMRGTFANVRLRNRLAPGTEGGFTTHFPSGETCTIFDASLRYREDAVPLLVIAGKEYGTGSSRDWAAKGPRLLGVRAVIAESFERIHRSNLVGMGILPLQFRPGESAGSLGLKGDESYSVEGLGDGTAEEVTVRARSDDGRSVEFTARVRIDTPKEVEYYRHGGILNFVLRRMNAASS